jgi:putative MFS transporter
MSVFGLAMGFATTATALVATGFLYTSAANFFSNALHIFQVEIFPTFARASAGGLTYGVSRLSSGAMPFILIPILEQWGAGAMFGAIAGALWVVIADIALFAPRTTGLSLEHVSH